MIAIQVGLMIGALATAQTYVEPQHDAEELAAMQAAARRLDDAAVKRYLAFVREVAKAQPKLEKIEDEAAREKAEEAAARAAAAKVGVPLEQVGPTGMLVSEWFMLQAAPGTPQELFARRASFVKRFGEGAVKVLGKAEPEIRASMQQLIGEAMERHREQR